MTPNDDEFYIGYEPHLPEATGRRVRMAVVTIAAVFLLVAVVVTAVQRPLAASSFAFGRVETWQGYLTRVPAPALLVPHGQGFERVWLVGRGKHGAEAVLEALPDGWITVRGSLIERDPWRMVEVAGAEATKAPVDAPPMPAPVDGAGRAFRGRGEIVDSKCFLGVMNPGERTVHRDCAIRCLSGGVAPIFSYVDDSGRPALAVLVNARGLVPPADLRPFVGRRVVVEGWLHTISGAEVLQLGSVSGMQP